MDGRVSDYARSWEVSGNGCSVEVLVFEDGDVMITADEDAGCNSQRVIFTMTAEEATLLKKFLIRKGY